MRELAISIFNERSNVSKGKWCSHSVYVAEAASLIAERIGLDNEKAYAMGLLHDIGRSFSNGQFMHIRDGYEYMSKLGYPELAKICLTHSFAVQDIYTYVGEMDVAIEEQRKYQILLKEQKYDSYDRLIQLCDSISTEKGYVLPEQKFVINAFKYGINDTTLGKWRAVLHLYEGFSEKIGVDVIEYL